MVKQCFTETPPQVSPPQCVRMLSDGEGTQEAPFLQCRGTR